MPPGHRLLPLLSVACDESEIIPVLRCVSLVLLSSAFSILFVLTRADTAFRTSLSVVRLKWRSGQIRGSGRAIGSS